MLSGKELTVVEIDKGSDGKVPQLQAGPFAVGAAADCLPGVEEAGARLHGREAVSVFG